MTTTSGQQDFQPVENNPVFKVALAYLESGLSVIPIRADGTKTPVLSSWKKFQSNLANGADCERWFLNEHGFGLAIVCGKISSNLTVLDFDHPEPFHQWSREMDSFFPDWRELCTLVRTPAEGYHVYLHAETVLNNTKLASFQGKAIETRGEGGYVLAPGCPAACHRSGKLYEHVSGPKLTERGWVELPSAIFDNMIGYASLCGESVPEPALACDKILANSPENRPGSLYNELASWEEVLVPFGWRSVREAGETVFWQRPGKEGHGWSATTGKCGSGQGGKLYVFSSNASPFEARRTYSKFAAYTVLNHNGDFKAAAAALAEKFGLARAEKVTVIAVHDQPPPSEEAEDDWPTAEEQPWPEQPDDMVYDGLVGDIVTQVLPQTSADPVAILVQVKAMFGNIIGRSAYFQIEDNRHYANIFACLCGPTGRGRKGVSKGRALRSFECLTDAGDEWATKCIQSGLQTGEGLIWSVRDPIWKTQKVRQKGGVTEEEDVCVDDGVDDKRLCVLEDEFGLVLQALLNKENTLSGRVRLAWDTGTIKQMIKNNRVQCTNAHITIVGHVTIEELVRLLDDVQLANGFANRFLWIAVKQSKSLPLGGEPVDLGILTQLLADAAQRGKRYDRLHLDAEAKEFWCDHLFPRFERQLPGLLGAVTSRAAPQVLRLAIIDTVLEGKPQIGLRQLMSAAALWDYCERSCAFIFGSSLGDSIADEIRHTLKLKGATGMTLTEVRDLFNRGEKGSAIHKAVSKLLAAGLAKTEKAKKPGGGRPSTRLFSTESPTKPTKPLG